MTIDKNDPSVTPKNAGEPVASQQPVASQPALPPEFGGRKNAPEATRYGDWEINGKCVDF